MQENLNPIYTSDHLKNKNCNQLSEHFIAFLNNKPAAGKMLEMEIMNLNYDYQSNEGYYRLLTHDQVLHHDKLHERRKENPSFDVKIKGIALMGGLIYSVIKLIEVANDN